MTFQDCSPIKQVCLDLGQFKNSCPSSISIPGTLAFTQNIGQNQGHAVNPEQQNILGLKSQPQNGSEVLGSSLRMQ